MLVQSHDCIHDALSTQRRPGSCLSFFSQHIHVTTSKRVAAVNVNRIIVEGGSAGLQKRWQDELLQHNNAKLAHKVI